MNEGDKQSPRGPDDTEEREFNEALDEKLGDLAERENATPGPGEPPPIRWNEANGVVQDHRDGTIDWGATHAEREARGLDPLPGSPFEHQAAADESEPPQPGITTLRPGRGSVMITVDGLLNIAGSLAGLLGVVAPGTQLAAQIVGAAPLIKAAQSTLENVVLPEIQRLFAAGRITAEQEAQTRARYEEYRNRFAEVTGQLHWQKS